MFLIENENDKVIKKTPYIFIIFKIICIFAAKYISITDETIYLYLTAKPYWHLQHTSTKTIGVHTYVDSPGTVCRVLRG